MNKLKIKLLIVDDEKDIRDSLGDILTDEGFNVFLAKNAANAINFKKKTKNRFNTFRYLDARYGWYFLT